MPATSEFLASLRKLDKLAATFLPFALTVCGAGNIASAQTKAATATTLAVASRGATVTTVASGSVITLTAAVQAGSTALTTGQVNFCDAPATYCTDIHLLGTAQLTSSGTAVLKLRPGNGTHSYTAVFQGTNNYAASISGTSALNVTGTIATLASTTTIAESGGWGTYTLTATVTEVGGTISPTGNVSFLDISNGSSVLDALPLGASVAGISWPNPLGLTTNTSSQAVALGDFNGDGIPDIVAVAGGTIRPLMIWLGNPDGTYTAAPTPPMSAYTFRPIIVADFNGDGKQDLAILNGDSNTVSILLGNGDGTFTVSASSPGTGSTPNQLALGDFNGDGIPDLAVTTYSDVLTILQGNGDGTFTTSSVSPAVGSSPYAIAVGDFNRDGKMDLAVTHTYDDTVSILLGNGDATFAAAAIIHCGSSDSPIAAADFSGNGKLDLAVGVSAPAGSSDAVTILAGNGDGTFTSPQAGQPVSSNSISSVQVGDFNGDGIPDLVLTDSNAGTAIVFLGVQGGGSFSATSLSLAGAPYYKPSFAVGDINGDGRADLAVGNDYNNGVMVYVTEPTQTATATANIGLPSAGLHEVEASYGGDSYYLLSISGTTPLWGVPPATTTTMSLISGGAQVTSIAPGTVVTLTAKVMAGASPVTAGQVNFCDASASHCTDIHVLATVQLTKNGTATFKFVPEAGQHSYKAVFLEGGSGMSSASNVANLTVGPAPAPVYTNTTSISLAGPPGDYSLTANVEGFGGTTAPTGSVRSLTPASEIHRWLQPPWGRVSPG